MEMAITGNPQEIVHSKVKDTIEDSTTNFYATVTDLDGDASDPPPDAHILTSTTLNVPAAGGYLQWWDWYGAELADTREVYVNGVLVYSDAASARNQRYWEKKALKPLYTICVF